MTIRRTFLKASGIGLVFATIAPLGFLQHGHKVYADKENRFPKDVEEKWREVVWSTKDSRFVAISANNNVMSSENGISWNNEKTTPKLIDMKLEKIISENYDNNEL